LKEFLISIVPLKSIVRYGIYNVLEVTSIIGSGYVKLIFGSRTYVENVLLLKGEEKRE